MNADPKNTLLYIGRPPLTGASTAPLRLIVNGLQLITGLDDKELLLACDVPFLSDRLRVADELVCGR